MAKGKNKKNKVEKSETAPVENNSNGELSSRVKIYAAAAGLAAVAGGAAVAAKSASKNKKSKLARLSMPVLAMAGSRARGLRKLLPGR